MKKACLLVFLFSFSFVQAQESDSKLAVSYFGLYAIKPGVKVIFETAPQQFTFAQKQVYILPQLAWYTESDNFQDWLINFELDQRFGQAEKSYWSYGLGLGYVVQSKILSFSQNLGSGQRDNVQRTTNHFFHPSGIIAWHKNISEKSNLFFKYTLGHKFSSKAPNEMTMFLETGIEIKLK